MEKSNFQRYLKACGQVEIYEDKLILIEDESDREYLEHQKAVWELDKAFWGRKLEA